MPHLIRHFYYNNFSKIEGVTIENGDKLNRNDIIGILNKVSMRMQEKHVDLLRDLDAEIGDGDLGVTIQRGFKAVGKYLSDSPADDIAQLLDQVGQCFSEANPSTFSALFATAFRNAGLTVNNNEVIGVEDLYNVFQSAVDAIMKLGNAQAGDKTLLDALIPATEAVRITITNKTDFHEVLKAAEKALKTKNW